METTPSTLMRDTLDQLRELYHAVKKKTKKREEASYYHKEEKDGRLDLAHFASTATSGSEQQEEERIQMNELPYCRGLGSLGVSMQVQGEQTLYTHS